MKKTFYPIITLLILAITISCSKNEKINSVSIDPETLTLTVGKQYQLTANVSPMSSEKREIIWNSTNSSVVSVNSEGLATALSIGTATVTAEVNNIIAKCEVTVIKEGDYMEKITMTKEGDVIVNKLIVILPIPLSNEYQEISNTYCNCGDNIESCNGNHILYYNANFLPEEMAIYTTFDYTPKKVSIDFSKKPEKKNEYGGTNPGDFLDSDGKYINLNNSTIRAIGDSIWAISDDNLDYARKCYEHAASILEYKDGRWSTLSEIIENGGGTSSDLTTFYVNLLRYKQIPARHNLGRNPVHGRYVWADFYDEEYGWIPVDLAHKLNDPENDYFGKYDLDYVVLGQGLTTFHDEDVEIYSYPLHSSYHKYKRSDRSGKLVFDYSFEQPK